MKRLQDKFIMVTGSSSGLGAAAALYLAAEGAKVVVGARRQDRGEALIGEIMAAGGDGIFLKTDVTRTAAVLALIAAAINSAASTGPSTTPASRDPR